MRRTFITKGRWLKIFGATDGLTTTVVDSISGKLYDGAGVYWLQKPLQLIANMIEWLMLKGTLAKIIEIPATEALYIKSCAFEEESSADVLSDGANFCGVTTFGALQK